ncbi:uncharacterized protein LOC115245321 [Formica exsecta]|uniref:uncharacterized protein LOC115245321 n=1 Tax=Formica exsecta TaxID=72781 RepID=UPI0011414014|nr:uncharacterized protein LOC115245321 [Formica exsecta]
MLLCSILRAALSASFGTVVQIAIFLLQNSNISRVLASMPPGAEDEIILIEHLPGRRVHLQDFFWTGLEDAPPWVDPNQGLTFYETKTIVHTVTVYTPSDEKSPSDPISPHRPDTYNPECITCIEPTPRLDDDDQSIGVLIGDDPGQRYWLLTVLRPGEAVPPKVELRLARLYRTAFSRQQQRHLGLLSTDPRSRRDALLRGLIDRKVIPEHFETLSRVKVRQEEISVSATKAQSSELTVGTVESSSIHEETEASVSNITDDNKLYFPNVSQIKSMRMIEIPRPKTKLLPTFDVDATDDREKPTKEDFALKKIIKTLKGDIRFLPSDDEPTTINPTYIDETNNSNEQIPRESIPSINLKSDSKSNTDFVSNRSSDDESAGMRSRLRLADGSIPGIVKVRMQNTSVIEGGAMRLIYSVHLDDKPVPAETAARDMALLSPQEVALELGAPVIIQSEPYLKESRPLALSRKRDAWLLLIGAASAGVILLILVLTGLILAAKKKRAHSAAVAPPNRSILKKEREYAATTPGLDNAAFSTSETEIKTDGTSQRQTPRTLSRTPITPDTPDSLELGIHEVSSDDDEEPKKIRGSTPWDIQEHPVKKASPVATPTTEIKTRPRTSLPRRDLDEDIPETGQAEQIHSRNAWGSRPLSAGPFHRPNLPEVDTRRILADSRLPPEDPAVPLIASIKKELEKFSP